MQVFTARLAGSNSDVSAGATWSVEDAGLGHMSGSTFCPSTSTGGSTHVRASYALPDGGFVVGRARVNLREHVQIGTGCSDCPSFPGGGAPPCAGGAAPSLVYPPDGVLLPPNMNVLEIQFMPGQGNDLFEVVFRNDVIDLRVEMRCNAVTSSRQQATGGCAYPLDETVWSHLVQTNRGGDPVKVSVRGAPGTATCASASAERALLFASEDIKGGLYYWQSAVYQGAPGKTGGIYRHDFGATAAAAEPFLTAAGTNTCVGCHTLSRDGKRMTVGFDDADADDEYLDIDLELVDVASKSVIKSGLGPGFTAFSPDHRRLLTTEGRCLSVTALFYRRDGDSGAPLLPDATIAGVNGQVVTQPDWTRDGKLVYFVGPGELLPVMAGPRLGLLKDDRHFSGGSIYRTPYDGASDSFGAAQVVITAAAGENNYYPSVSPDGRFLVFNRVSKTGTTIASRDAYNNPNARLWALFLGGMGTASPVDMQRANEGDGLTNSWPRWSPFIQSYQGKPLLWVTFSSTRDYGLRVQNRDSAGAPRSNCYPPGSPEDPAGSMTAGFDDCAQPQIWMAAVALTELEQMSTDPSFPAFWLPFQDATSHNHLAQWTEEIQ